MSAESLIKQMYGVDVPIDSFRKISEKQLLAQKYINKVINEAEEKYSSADSESLILAEYESNKSAYDTCDVVYIYCETTEDAVHIVDAINGGASLEDAINTVAPDTQTRPLKGYTREVISQQFSSEAAEWIYAADDNGEYKNKAGSAATLNIQGGSYVIYQNSEPARDESRTGTVSYVYFPATVADAGARAERVNQAAQSADSAEAFETAATEAADTTLGITYTADTAADGVDDAVTEWALSSGRQEGDAAVITGMQNGGTYVVRYNGESENPAWYQNVISTLANADMDTWYSDFTDSYKDRIVTDDAKISSLITELTGTASAS